MRPSELTPAALPEERSAALPAVGGGRARLQVPRSIQWAQALVLVVLFTAPAVMSLRLAYIADPDIWWHLRSAEWMVTNHAVLRTDPFSSFGAGRPSAAYSWLYELVVYGLFQRLGLVGIVAYSTGMAVIVAFAIHRLMRHLQSDFTFAVLLTAFASYCMSRFYTPRPWLFSALLFVLEVDFLMQARRSGKRSGLLWLPVIFVLWVNLHIQFIDGLVVLAIALAESLAARRWNAVETGIRAGWMFGISSACVLATMVNPYGWNIYRIAYSYASLPGIFDRVTELNAIPFRRIDDWCVLLVTLAAVAVLARARRVDFLESGLLVFAVYVSFRSQRDLWVVVIAGCTILAAGLKGSEENRLQLKAAAAPLVVTGTIVAVWLSGLVLHVNNAHCGTILPRRCRFARSRW
jgi:hypothetical protein